ncbi:MAG: hypothetical protein K8L99_18745 [Anaerolineae bacterium]|nr:hypothetical protein [Anaerolineae bacterium]
MAENSRIKAVERATGRTWEEWLQYMDRIDAKNLSHHEIASRLLEELDGKIDNIGWWAQATTVAYEQHIGRRIPGQRPDGTFQTSVSKATTLGMQELMDKWENFAAGDQEVSALIADEARVSGTEKRITWRTKGHDGSSIRVTSEPKKNGTASIIVNHMELQTNELNMEAKAKWSSIVERFLETL